DELDPLRPGPPASLRAPLLRPICRHRGAAGRGTAAAWGKADRGRYGMRGFNDQPGGSSSPGQGCSATGSPLPAWPGPALAVPSATAAGVIDGAPVENPCTSWYTFGCDAPPRNPGQ